MTTITVSSAYKLAPAELKAAQALAESRLGVSGTITNVIDKTVIAGIKIEAGSRELDLSMSGTLDRMAATLA